MKRKFNDKVWMIILILTMVFLGGCGLQSQRTPLGWWIKDGVSKEETLKDFYECKTIRFTKENMDNFDKDWQFCDEAGDARRRHRFEVVKGIGWAAIIPFAGLAIPPVQQALTHSTDDYSARCMETKGYKVTTLEIDSCMKQKGYSWGQ